MKKYFYSLLAATTMLFAAACSQDEELVAGGNDGGQTVTFEVALPGATQTRAIAVNGETAEVGKGNVANKLIYALYEKVEGELKQGSANPSGALTQGVATDSRADGHFEVKLDMVKGLTYEILFLAYNEDNCIFDIQDPLTQDLRQLTLKSTLEANKESYDAFVASVQHSVNAEAVTYIELTRPFAQVNAATTLEDLNKTKILEAVVTKSQLTINQVPTQYNVFTAEATNPKDLVYKSAAILNCVNAAGKAHPNEEIEVEDKDYYYLTLAYVLAGKTADADKSLHNAKFEFFRDAEPTLVQTVNIANLPIQRNYRTNVIGNLLTQSEGFEVVIDAKFNDEEHNQVFVSTADQLKEILNTATENTKVYLTADITLKGQTGAYTATAGEIVIDGSKNITRSVNSDNFTITFEDSYRSYVGFSGSDTKIVFNNVNISRKTTGGSHWHDNNMKFACNAEFNNVAFDKGICFDDAKTFVMNNCSINKGKVATYALFITAGCDVTIDGLSVTHAEGVAGRGIKIVDEDVAEPTLTILSVSNATFVTESKAAILVGSKEGAKITLDNLDITKVKADNFNAVWVDEDYKDYADKVTVEGGFVVVEGSADENNPFLIEGNTVKVTKGVYGALPKVANGVTIEAEEGTVFTGTSSVSGENVTIKNVIFDGEKVALTRSLKGTKFENCHFDAKEGARWCYAYGDVVFNDCTFGDENCIRGVHFDDGDGTVTFNGCTLYGFQALASGVEKMTFNDCEFAKNNNYNVVNMYSEYEFNNCKFNPSMNADCAGNGVVAAFNNCSYTDGKSICSLVRFDKDPATCTITFDGKQLASTSEQLIKLLQNEEVSQILLGKGTFNFGAATIAASEVTITGSDKENSVINMNKSINQPGKTLNLNNLTYTTPKGLNYDEHNFAFIHYVNLNMDNCIVKEGIRLNIPSGNITNCDFIHTTSSGFDGYPLFYYGADGSTLNVEGCTFNTVSKGIVIYSESAKTYNLSVEGCTFTASKTDDKAAIQMHTELGITGKVHITNCSATGFADPYSNGGLWNELNNQNGTKTDKFDIWVDGTQVH